MVCCTVVHGVFGWLHKDSTLYIGDLSMHAMHEQHTLFLFKHALLVGIHACMPYTSWMYAEALSCSYGLIVLHVSDHLPMCLLPSGPCASSQPLDKLERAELNKQALRFVEPGFKMQMVEKVRRHMQHP